MTPMMSMLEYVLALCICEDTKWALAEGGHRKEYQLCQVCRSWASGHRKQQSEVTGAVVGQWF